jgi:hypothetical protein
MGQPWSDEQKKAASERYHAAALAKKAHAAKIAEAAEQEYDATQPEIKEPETKNTDYGDMLALISELKESLAANTAETAKLKADLERAAESKFSPTPTETPQVNQRGQMVGTFEKYKLDPKYYPDPTPRLALEPKLSRFAFGINYVLGWEVTSVFYETIDGVKTREPRFLVELNRVMLDEETGLDTGGRYTIRSFVMHEDPEAAIVVAREQGLDIDALSERDFLDEMRYLRIKAWLMEAFYPPKRDAEKKNKKEMVIGGKVVQYFEVSSPDAKGIAFGELDGKI